MRASSAAALAGGPCTTQRTVLRRIMRPTAVEFDLVRAEMGTTESPGESRVAVRGRVAHSAKKRFLSRGISGGAAFPMARLARARRQSFFARSSRTGGSLERPALPESFGHGRGRRYGSSGHRLNSRAGARLPDAMGLPCLTLGDRLRSP